ncbi:MAG: ribonuclease P protein subunit [Candidatus Micrarchaeota archaeon]
MRTSKNLIYHALISLEVEVVNSSDKKLIGLKGIVVDETKNLLIINVQKTKDSQPKSLKIQKISSTFKFCLENNQFVIIQGNDICFRPEERAKKLM